MSSTEFFKAKEKRKTLFSFKSLIAPLIIIFSIISVVVIHQKVFLIKQITCRMGDGDCPEAIVSLLDREKGRSFLLLNSRDVEHQILSTGLVDGLDLKTSLPGKLLAKVQPPVLTFFVKTAFTQVVPSLSFLVSSISASPTLELNSFIATSESKAFQLLSTGVLTQADGDSNYYLVDQSIPSRQYLIKAFGWLHSLSTSAMKPEKLFFLSDMIILKEKDQPDLIMNFSDDPATTLLSLQRLSEIVTMKKPTVIDFRFSHPILK